MTAGETYRCFLAVEVEEIVRQRMQELQARLSRCNADLRFPHPSDLHLTLLFLGDTQASDLPRLVELMDGVARFHDPFTLVVEGVSAFGPSARPRVLWAGVKNSPPLLRLQQVLADGVARLGLPVEPRSFEPHLTLARVYSIGNDRSLTTALASITHSALGESHVSRIVLMRSKLDSEIARYSVLHASPLKGSTHHAP